MAPSTTIAMTGLRPAALALPDEASVRWNSLTKAVRQPEQYWPAQIYERPIITGRVRDRAIALIADPVAAQIVLTGPESQFPKWRIYERVVGAGMGRENLSAGSGLRWQRQRQAFAPLFSTAAAAGMVPLFRAAAERAMAGWGAASEIEIDAGLEMTQLTLGIIWELLFSAKRDATPPHVVTDAARVIYDAQLRGDIDIPGAKIGELADAARYASMATALPSDHPFHAWGSGDAAQDPEKLTDQELYDNARNFLAAGHETTALTLIWALWLTAQEPDVQDRIHREVDAIVGSEPIEDCHIDHLIFAGQVIKETMRLFPPAFVTVRRTTQAIILAGESLPAGAVLAVCIYALHRHRDWWDAPELFRPERFAAGEPRHRYAYLPFSAGPHACIGARFAWREVIVLFASILRRFRLSTAPRSAIRPRAGITIRPDREVHLTLQRLRYT